MSGWPDPDKPGVPLHPELDGWHWVTAADPAISTRRTPWFWDHKKVGWMPPVDVIGFPFVSAGRVNWSYLGPCLTPSEVAALSPAVAGIVSSTRVEMADGFRLAAKVALAALEPSDGIFYSASANSDLSRAHHRVKQKLEEAAEAWDINMEGNNDHST